MLLYAFYDEALEKIWNSISDITHPTLKEYRLLDEYLRTKRHFLDIPSDGYESRMYVMRNFSLLGPNEEMPIFNKYSFNITECSKYRCIVLFVTHTDIYIEKVECLLSELKSQGYSGHVLLNIGGFPNTHNGSLKLCHVPYAFKLAALQEAQALGYQEVLWLDVSLHPLTNLEMIFSEIKRKGYFFTSVGSLHDNAPSHRPEAAQAVGISTDLYPQIPHISSSVFGLDLKNSSALMLLDHWAKEVEEVYPCISWFPEELSLSVVAWRLHCKPFSWFGTIVCLENELNWLPQQRPTIQLYLDARR